MNQTRRLLLLPLFLLVALGTGHAAAYAAPPARPGMYLRLRSHGGFAPDQQAPGRPAATATAVVPSAPQPASAYPTVGKAAPSAASYALTFSGSAVSFDMSGFEPDFDPLYKITISGNLRDQRPPGQALPDARLVLLAYLEVFQPDTTPVLPDLLHPNQVATNLAGFLSGKAALVNVGGEVVYRGSLLAEIFQNSTEHLIVDLYPTGKGPSVRLQGAVALHKGGAENGTLRALTPLAPPALAVPRGHMPTWQAIVNAMSVSKPTMMGTAAAPGQRAPSKPTTIAPLSLVHATPAACDPLCQVRRPGPAALFALGLVLLLLGSAISVRRLRHR